jgi:hypothetical protein
VKPTVMSRLASANPSRSNLEVFRRPMEVLGDPKAVTFNSTSKENCSQFVFIKLDIDVSAIAHSTATFWTFRALNISA